MIIKGVLVNSNRVIERNAPFMSSETKRQIFYTGPELSQTQEAALKFVLQNKEEFLARIVRHESKKQTVLQTDTHGESRQKALHVVFDPEYEIQQKELRAQARRTAKKKMMSAKVLIPTVLLVIALVAGGLFGLYTYIINTTPPTVNTVDHTIRIGETVSPEDFISTIYSDFEIISIAFLEAPDTSALSNQNVQLRVTDDRDNVTIVQATLYITLNESPPVITGTGPIISRIGNPIVYRTGVTARDDFGRTLELQVDSSDVDLHTEGEYIVLYYAIDLSGLRTEVRESVHILNVDVDYVNGHIDATLSDILTEGMSQLEQVHAIHTWVITNIAYAAGTTDPGSAYEDAYRALRDRQGNCYKFYAISELMLTRAGIDNMPINRIPGTPTRHRWSLINPDGLGWHHFDTTPTRLGLGSETAFFTDSQAREFTQRFVEFNGTEDFYTYDPSLYPLIVQ
jgi:hypothetical protein